jgi:hypothetical protein
MIKKEFSIIFLSVSQYSFKELTFFLRHPVYKTVGLNLSKINTNYTNKYKYKCKQYYLQVLMFTPK